MTRAEVPTVRIEPWSEGDLDLLRRANAPEMMEHLGGPETEEQLLARHRRYLTVKEPGEGQMFRVVLVPDEVPVGTIGYWEKDWRDEMVYETGWGVLPEFQGRGIAVAATLAAMTHARAVGRHRYVHAFPSIHHRASNGVCRSAGFTLMGEFDFEYPPGHLLRSYDWCFDLADATRTLLPPE